MVTVTANKVFNADKGSDLQPPRSLLLADKGDDYCKYRLELRTGSIKNGIAHRGIKSRQRLGDHCRIAKRPLA